MVPLVILLSRVGNSMSFNTVYVTNNRLFPTHFLTSSFGLLNFISHIISIAAPMVAEVSNPYPMGIFLINSIIALISAIFIKELYHSPASSVVSH